MADIGRAVAKHLPVLGRIVDIRYRFAPVAFAAAVSDVDVCLERCGLVLLDFKALTGFAPKCPGCNKVAQQQDAGYPDNARSCKGDADVHTWYLMAKRRKCVKCSGETPMQPWRLARRHSQQWSLV